MAQYHELYRRAHYYDIVFDRDVSREVDFIAAVYARNIGRDPSSVVDVACGPAYHAREFARRGVMAYGVDVRPEMVELARVRAEAERLRMCPITADMRDFRLPESVDVAFSIFDGIDCLLTNDELLAHLRTVAANLKPDGLYLIDLTHPRDCSLWGYGDFQYTGERDGCRVTIDWATNAPQADPLSGVIDIEVLMRVTEPDGSQHEFRDRARERLLLPQEIVALAERSGVMRVVGWYGDFRLEQPFDNTREARRMICVLSNSPPREAASPRSFVSPKLVVKPSPKHGYGLFANAPINSGDVLVVWAGTVIQTTDLVRLDGSLRGRALQIEEGLHLVGDPEPADYVNHSCMPNAGLSGQVALVARHAIEVGEEICYDYAMSEGTAVAEDAFECCCGTSVCRGRITGEDWCRPDLQSAYAGFFSPYLERRMLARWRTS